MSFAHEIDILLPQSRIGENVKTSDVVRAWARILAGRAPSLSIEITKECPLRCPGCYAFDAAHLGGTTQLRELSDYKGDELVMRVLALIDAMKPLHVSLVGGDPMVRFRELSTMLPKMESRGLHTQIVTSAFRAIPEEWNRYKRLSVVVSVDGLQPEHDARRKPATYERILKNIEGAKVTIHCTITAQIAERPGYLDEFLAFWTRQPGVAKVWFSIFTPQRGATDGEILQPRQRAATIEELRQLRLKYAKLEMPEAILHELSAPPRGPEECIFARTTETISADLKTPIAPCQFGGNPDCSQCGCYASMGLAAVGHHRVAGPLTAGQIFKCSERFGKVWGKLRRAFRDERSHGSDSPPFTILKPDATPTKRTPLLRP